MDKAIERTIEFFISLDESKHIHGIPAPTGIIAELTAHKAKIEELKEWLQKEYSSNNNSNGDGRGGKGYYNGIADNSFKILQKLEELDK